jgi:hypothetical protein
VTEANAALVEFNRRNHEFWVREGALMERRMADPAVLETAVETIAYETTRHVPIQNQMSFEKALEHAENAKRRFIRELARTGGKAEKTDSLQELIIEIVRSDPGISLRQLLEALRRHERGSIIDEIDVTHIHYRTCLNGKKAAVSGDSEQSETRRKKERPASAPISGLKHRLTRARKTILKENQSR